MSSLLVALRDPDRWVVRLRYVDSKGVTTVRVVSPIRLEGDSVMVLCLAREECRRLIMARISNVELVAACDVLMPVEIIVERLFQAVPKEEKRMFVRDDSLKLGDTGGPSIAPQRHANPTR